AACISVFLSAKWPSKRWGGDHPVLLTAPLVSGGRASRNAATPVAIVYPVSMGPSFLRAFQNRLGTLGIVPADPKLRPRTPRIDDPEATEGFARHPAANPLAFECLPPELGRRRPRGGRSPHRGGRTFSPSHPDAGSASPSPPAGSSGQPRSSARRMWT